MAQPIRREPAFLRRKQVETRTGLSGSTIYRYITYGVFPKPVPLGPRAVGWIESDLCEWITGGRKLPATAVGNWRNELHAWLPKQLQRPGSRGWRRSLPPPKSFPGSGRRLPRATPLRMRAEAATDRRMDEAGQRQAVARAPAGRKWLAARPARW